MIFIPELLLLLATISGGEADDRDLTRRIRDGDHAAFRTFFERYHAPLLGYLRRRNMPQSEAEDLLQQAFIAVWENRLRLDENRSIRAFLYQIATNRSLNVVRDTRKFTADADFDNLPSDHSSPVQAHVSEGNPQQEAIFTDVQAHLHAAIQQLPEKRRQVFELCFVQELTYREAAEILGVSIKTVENQMGYALTFIRGKMTGLL